MPSGGAVFLTVLFSFFAACSTRSHHHHNHQHSHHKPNPGGIGGGASTTRLERITLVDSDASSKAPSLLFNPYTKHHPGRHVCTQEKEFSAGGLPAKEPCHKPIYKKYKQRCNNNQICNGIKVVYETTHNNNSNNNNNNKQTIYVCCPGWMQINNRSHGCNKPKCMHPCQNGGSCVKPDTCACLKGFYGKYCEHDINECQELKPCDQLCYNTLGSYNCQCRENFILQPDGQSCRTEGNDPGIEAKEMEMDMLDKRIQTLENILALHGGNKGGEGGNLELRKINNNIEVLSKDINIIQIKLQELKRYEHDVSFMKSQLQQVERQMIKVDELSAKYERMKKCAQFHKICI